MMGMTLCWMKSTKSLHFQFVTEALWLLSNLASLLLVGLPTTICTVAPHHLAVMTMKTKKALTTQDLSNLKQVKQ